MRRFEEVVQRKTSGANYGVSNFDVLNRLAKWERLYGVNVREIDAAGLTVSFDSLPDDVLLLASEIFEFCPDVVSQGFGCYEEMISEAEAAGIAMPPEVLSLADGIDFDDPEYGVKILARSLERDRRVHLWWD